MKDQTYILYKYKKGSDKAKFTNPKDDHYNFPEKKNKGVHIFHFISFLHHIHVQIQW